MSERSVIVVGGGPAGFFAAIACAQARRGVAIRVLEQGAEFLSKVRVSGGGRCNVTHACFDPRDLTAHYPRGAQALLGCFQVFQPRDTIAWFAARGVPLKTEPDGRMFPVTDSSQTIVDCLLREAKASGVKLTLGGGVTRARRRTGGGFELTLANGETLDCDRLLLATGGCRATDTGPLAAALGHSLEPPVPSLFALQLDAPWLRTLAGIAVEPVEVAVPSARLRERGGLLITHRGLSGPAMLRLSAWGARAFHAVNYRFPLRVDWLPRYDAEALAAELDARRRTQAARQVVNTPIAALPARLWEQLVQAAGIPPTTRWAAMPGAARHRLQQQLARTELSVTGRSAHREEFVTCGGVRLGEVNFKTMESRLCPGLHFAGELLDLDGLTGGFNFQAAWTTGWIAGRALAEATGA